MRFNDICEVLITEELINNIYSITIKAENIARQAQAGQFIHLKCSDSDLLRRPISISFAKDGKVTIVFAVKGSGTSYLSKLKKGDSIDVLGPLGRGYDFDVMGNRPVFIGGGIGCPPLLFACVQARQNGLDPDAILGFKSAQDMILVEKFKTICKNVYVTTDDGSFSRKGFVSDVLADHISLYTSVNACGPVPMLKAVSAQCSNIPCQISLEEHMGCGIGACLVCACKIRSADKDFEMKHVCKDGPVFDAKKVIL